MPARNAQRLYDLEVDEISLVDRPANQHGTVMIAKRAAEDRRMPLYDEEGYELDENLLEPGDVAFDENGQQLVLLSDEEAEGLADELGVDVESLAGLDFDALDQVDEVQDERGNTRELATVGKRGRGPVRKSAGDEVFQEIAKALRGSDAQEAVSKLAGIVKESRQEARAAWALVNKMAEEQDHEDFVQLAQQYPVAADPRALGGVLARISKNQATDQDVAYLDRVLSAEPVAYDEAGFSGYAENSVMDQVSSLALSAVSKADDITHPEAIVAVFDANPDAYDMYLREQA